VVQVRRNVLAAGVLSAGLLGVVGVAAAYGGSAPEPAPAGSEIVLDSPVRSSSGSSSTSGDQAVAELATTTEPAAAVQQAPAVVQQQGEPGAAEPEPEPTITTITTTTAPPVEPEPEPEPGQREPSTVPHTPTCATYLPDGSCLSWA
jgi:hypothetical protein